ncbi:MAG: ABC transporter permease [Cyanobacteriota/Melainabacteria group bacterium]
MQKDDLGEIAIVFRKDILELFRDYRSLLIMVVMPILLYPLFLILPAIVATKIKADIMHRHSRIALVGDYAPMLKEMKKSNSLTLSPEHDPSTCMKLLRAGKLDLVVQFPSDFSTHYNDVGKVPEIKLIFNQRKELSLVSAQNVSGLLSDIKENILRLRTRSYSLKLPSQYNLEAKEIEVDQKHLLVSDPVRTVVPFLLFTMVLVAISYPAIDIITGERERKSLQVLCSVRSVAKTSSWANCWWSRSVGYLPSPSV